MLFGGDVELDSKQEATEFAAWLKSLPQKHKVMTFGAGVAQALLEPAHGISLRLRINLHNSCFCTCTCAAKTIVTHNVVYYYSLLQETWTTRLKVIVLTFPVNLQKT